MSDDESDLESEGYGGSSPPTYGDHRLFEGYGGSSPPLYADHRLSAEKRAHHNALERKRRDHIKDRFNSLKEAIPSIRNEKAVSRAQILKKAADYILHMKVQQSNYFAEIETLKRQNALLETQCQFIETQKFQEDKNRVEY